MSGFRLRLNRLKNIPYASSIQAHLPFEKSFELEYFFDGLQNTVIVKPILISNVVIFLVHFPGGEAEPMALVYNKKDTWSDIEKESTGSPKPSARPSRNITPIAIFPGRVMARGITIHSGTTIS